MSGHGGAEVSPEARSLGEQLNQLSPEEFFARLERAMFGSAELRGEPELEDFYFEARAVLAATQPRVAGFQARLAALQPGDIAGAEQLYDEVRGEIIAELMTPPVRGELAARVQRCVDRLKRGRDTDRLETAFFVDFLLKNLGEVLAPGVCALFAAIYEASYARARQRENGMTD